MSPSAEGQAQLLSTVGEVRTILCFKVPEGALRARLPPGWRVVPYADAANAGANLRIPLTDQQMVLGADGLSRPGIRFAPFVVPAMRDGMDGPTPIVMAALVAYVGEGSYDPYGNATPAKAEIQRSSSSGVDATTTIEQSWSFEAADGSRLSLALRYVGGTATYGRRHFKIYSGARPEFYRIYRLEHAEDVVMSKPLGIDRTQSYAFRATGSMLSQVFDGSEELVSISALPWSRREIWLD